MGQERSPDDELVLPDGTVLVPHWHGAKMHPVTGVKGGLMVYPIREDKTADKVRTNSPVLEFEEAVTVTCGWNGCRRERTVPAWVARRHPYCSRSCAQRARHARRDKPLTS